MLENGMHRCAICGKIIYAPESELWTYKRIYRSHHKREDDHITWFCSYHCMRADEKARRPMSDGRWARE